MDADTFWNLIESSKARPGPLSRFRSAEWRIEAEKDRQLRALRRALKKRSLDELIAFDRMLFRVAHIDLNAWDLWAAAYVIMGGCGDDSFEYFRYWVVSRGRHVCEAAARDPDTLADLEIVEPDLTCEFEDFTYAAREVYQAKSGREMPFDESEGASLSAQPRGTQFDQYDPEDLRRRVPRVFQKHWPDE